VVIRYTTYPKERSIGCKMAQLEPILGYNRMKLAISQNRLLGKFKNANCYSSSRVFNIFA